MPTITLPGGRSYEWRPYALDTAPRPLIVALHESDHTGLTFETETALTTQAARWGAHVAYGNGVAGQWNAGAPWPGGSADDVAYLAAVYDDAVTRAAVDPDQVYLCGMSAGAAMAWRAAGEDARWTAAGSVAGWAPTDPARALDVLHIHGSADTTVPLGGGMGTRGVTFPPTYRESFRLDRSSRWSLLVHAGGHGWPGWAAQVLWDFWTRDRLAP